MKDHFILMRNLCQIEVLAPGLGAHGGLTDFRINPWGAFLLGQGDDYVPSQTKAKALFTIDADKRVHLVRSLSPSERLQLEAIATLIDEQTDQLVEVKLLTAVENGQQLDSLIDFWRRSHQGEFLLVIFDWLMGIRKNVNACKEVDTAVLIRLNQADLLATVKEDKALAKIC